jgi:hypothetical protein
MIVAKFSKMKCPKFDKINKILNFMVGHGGKGKSCGYLLFGDMQYTSKYYTVDLKVFKKGPQVNLVRKNISF